MKEQRSNDRFVWLVLGLLAGLAIASVWPHEPVQASATDRNQKFAMITTPVGGGYEGIFILDFLTGRLTGAVLGRTRNGTEFTNFYARNVAEDFEVTGEANYAITGGFAEIQAKGGLQWGNSAIYVAEMNSGKVAAYAIPFKVTQVPIPPVPLAPLAQYPFRTQNVAQ